MALTNNYNNHNNHNMHHTSRHPANNTIYPRNDPRDVDSDDDYDDDEDYDSDEDDIYDPEEESDTRFNIVYCDLYKELLHGETNNEHLKKSFLVINRYKKLDQQRAKDIEALMPSTSKRFAAKDLTPAEKAKLLEDVNKATALARDVNAKRRGMSAWDFDDTLALTKSDVLWKAPDGSTGKLNATEFAKRGYFIYSVILDSLIVITFILALLNLDTLLTFIRG